MTAPIRVAHLLGELHPSGAEVMLRVGADAFRRQGVTGTVVATGPAVGPYAPDLAAAGWPIRHLPLPDDGPAALATYLGRIRDLAREHDVVHLHSEKATIAFATAVRSTGTAAVRSIHSTFLFEGALRAERTVLRATQRAMGVRQVACGKAVAEHELARFRNRVSWSPNWFDVDRFEVPTPAQRATARAALDLPPTARVVVAVGNCAGPKNHPALLRAVADVDDSNLLLLHAGAEPDSSERDLARSLGISDRVRFLGRVDDVPGLLHAADLYAMPSRYEGFSIAALEALGTGLPTLFSARGGNLDHQAHLPDVAARWVEPEPGPIAVALRTWLAGEWGAVDPDAIRATIVDHHGVEVGVAGWVQHYRVAIAGRRRSLRPTTGRGRG